MTEPSAIISDRERRRPHIDAQTLREMLTYCRETGEFFWRGQHHNRHGFGARAGVTCNQGYRRIRISKASYTAHCLAWIYVYGRPPLGDIDHINGDKSDNRIENLRIATKHQNGANRPKNKNNKSGYKGVYWSKQHRKWQAKIEYLGKSYYLGLFLNPEEAHSAYAKKAAELVGEFARAA